MAVVEFTPRRWPQGIAVLLAALAIVHPDLAQDTKPPPLGPSETGATAPGQSISPMGPVSVPRAFIFFPPVPTPLDEPVSRAVEPRFGTPPPPVELSNYVGEAFYAPLSTLLLKGELRAKKLQRLLAYRVARDDLRTELRQELSRTPTTDPEARRRALESLAHQQAARLAALEETAESLRDDLVDGYYSWFGQREWQLGQRGRSDSPRDVEAVLRAYAYFHGDLPPEVRGLLREISMEFAMAKEDAVGASAAQPFLFFSPETARVRLPDDLPAAVADRVAEFETKKSALKADLYEAVRKQERANLFQGDVLKRFGTTEAARLTEQEKLAEHIRRDLATLPRPAKPSSSSPLPPELTERVAALGRSLHELQARVVRQIAEIERQLPSLPNENMPDTPLAVLSYSFDATGLVFEVHPARVRGKNGSVLAGVPELVERTRRTLAAVAGAYGRSFAEIVHGMNALRGDVVRTLVRPGDPTAEAALNETARYVEVQESAEGYRDYRTAVFEPGLSPAQRRLLFGQAIEGLRLPLPAGELQPGSW